MRPALERLQPLEGTGNLQASVVQSPFGLLIFSESRKDSKTEHHALLVNGVSVRGVGFVDGEVKHLYGYSPFVSNAELERFLTGFASETERLGRAAEINRQNVVLQS